MWPTVEMFKICPKYGHILFWGTWKKHSNSESDICLPESEKCKYFSFLLLHFGTTWFVREPDVHICYPLNHIFGENNIQAYTKKLPFLEVDSWS